MSSNHPLVSRLIVILFLMPGLATLLLVTPMADELGLVGEARGEDGTPEWSYSTGEEVKSVAISADGEYIAAGVIANGRVYLFHKDSSTPLWSHDTGDGVWSVAISADGEYIAAGSHDYKIYIFRKNSSTPLWSYTTDDNVNSVAISADGEYIAAGSHDYKVYLFHKDNSTPLWNYNTGSYVDSVTISADGEYIVAGSRDNKVYLFDKESSTPIWSYDTGDWVDSIANSADGEYIIAAASDKVYLFDKDNSTPLWNYTTEGNVKSVAISADGKYIAAGSGQDDDKVYLFNKDSSTPLWSYTTGVDFPPDKEPVAISANGEYIVAGSDDENVYLFKNPLPDLTLGSDDISFSDANPSVGDTVTIEAVVRNIGDASIDQWQLTSHSEDQTYPSFSPDDTKIAYASEEDGTSISDIWVMDSDGTNHTRLNNDDDHAFRPVFSPDSAYIYYMLQTDGWDIYRMEANGDNPEAIIDGSGYQGSHALSSDGTLITYINDDDIWVANSDGSDKRAVSTSGIGQNYPSFHPDGTKIVYGSKDDGGDHYDIWVLTRNGDRWNTSCTKQQITFEDENEDDIYPHYTPDGTKIVYNSWEDGGSYDDIWIMDSDGTDHVQLTTEDQRQVTPSVSNDGTKILYSSEWDDIWQINATATATVNFYDGDPDDDGTLIGSDDIVVWANATARASVEWQPEEAGAYEVHVVIEDVEPGDGNWTNNEASKDVVVSGIWQRMDEEPSAREGSAMVYDSKNKVMVLFSGRDGSEKFQDTWLYDVTRNVWIEKHPTTQPPGLERHAMAYDSVNEKVVLFGGYDSSSTRMDETWLYDVATNTWTEMDPSPKPEARGGAKMVFDPNNAKVVLFGGNHASGDSYKDDTWLYDVATNEWTLQSPPKKPSPRHTHGLAYDSKNEKVILFGGGDVDNLDDTWEYDVNEDEWTKLYPTRHPQKRHGFEMVYDSHNERIITFGGGNGSGANYETWTYDYATNNWTNMQLDHRPSSPGYPAVAYDSQNKKVVLIGGDNGEGEWFGETWLYDYATNKWTQRGQVEIPSPRHSHSMAYDSKNDVVVLFGGDANGRNNETWVYDVALNIWAQQSPLNSPYVRHDHSLVYDSANEVVVLFGGDADGRNNETWIYDVLSDEWTQQTPTLSPHVRHDHSMVFDSANEVVVLFGGDADGRNNETWFYNVASDEWTQLSLSISPPVRHDHSMVYDTANEVVVLFGGDADGRTNDTWTYSNALPSPTPIFDGIIVDINGNGNYTSIQAAIDNATAGETIRVWAGTYDEDIVVDKELDIIGNGSSTTVIDGGGGDAVVDIRASKVTLSGFNITNGSSGIDVNSHDNTLTDNVITNNIFYGIRFDSSNSNNLISGNLISDNDFGISFDSSNTDNTISDNNISNNEYNGIQFSSSNNNNTLSGNSIWNNYRGIVFDSSSNRNTISGNDISISARGIYFKSSNDNNTLSGNNISNSDYGISFVSSNNNNTLNGNNLSDNIIGIRFGYLNSHNTISKNTISINSYGVHLASANNSFNIVNVNNITGNINDGISSESLVNAEYNWWGDASGPGGDGPGNGDGINNASNIDYSPWLGRPVGTVPMEYRVDGFIVDINGNGDHTSIQAAIDNATAGETIRVWAGTYNENVVVDKALTLIGNGSAGTIIDGSDSGIVVELIADGVTLSGFNITNGSVQGIYVHSSNNLIQDNVIVANNENGIYLHRNADHNTITGNTIIWNEVFGIETYDLSDITIQDNTISNNRDGMRLRQTYDSVVAGNEVTHHEEEGIYLQITDNVTVMDNTVTNNNYGINLRDSSYAQITGNTASFNGDSGIYIGLDSHNNTIRENTCNNSTKAGIWIRGEGAINNTVENNDCSGNQLFSLSITSTHRNTLSNNTLTDNNIGIDIEWAHNNTIVNNTSTGGTKGILLHDSQNNTFIDSSFTDTSQYDIHLESGSVDNVLINSSFSTILCDATSSLAVKNYLTVKTVYQEAPFAGADVEVTDDTTVYASSHYGGSNAKTDAKGAIERLAVTDRHYEGSSTPMDVNSTLKVRYREWEEERSIDMSTSHTEVFEVELVGTIELETDKTIYQAEDRVTITGYYNGSHDRVDLTITKPDESVLVDDSLAVLNFDDFLTDGLVGHWPFDDGTALDSSGSEYHGTLYGEPGVVEGILGKGLHFDGDGDYGSTEKNITLTGKASRTMSAWINVGDRYDDGVTLIFEWGDHNPDRAGSALSYNYAQSSIIFRGNNEDLQSPQNSAPINAWHHVVFTYDGTTGRIFINGVESVNGTLDLNTTSTTMNIGNDPNNPDKTGWNRWFNGTMDDLRLFDRELTPQQVRDLYDHSLGNLPNFGYEFNLPIDTPTGIYTVRANTTDAQNSTTFEVVSADLPDLSIIAEDITFLPGSPYENATVTINATVRNLGDSAGLGNVSFYLGEPQGPVNLIDTVAIETPIPANGSKAVQVDWEKAVEGEHDIHVVIDNVLPTDSDLQNNEAFVSIDVIGYVLEVVTENDTYLPGERVDLNMTYDGGQSYATVKVKYPNGTVLLERVVQVNGLEEGLVGYWSFDEHTNVSVFDLTENDNDGSVTGANWTDGILGEALELDGANLGIEIPDSTSLDITGELTLEAWVRITNHDQPHTIFNKYNPPPSGATFILGTRESTGRVIFDINPDEHYKIGTTNLTDGQWHHVVGVFVPSTSLEIYVDGVKEEYTENVGSPPSAIDPNDRPLVIGRFFDGAMDELKIYNRALSEEEILVRYQKRAGSATFTLPLDAPAGNYSVRVNTTDAWASTSFEVKEPFLDLPDLWLTVDDIVFDPAKPLVNETIIVSANVHNTGSVDGSGWARYYDGDPDSGSQLIGQEAITVWSEDATNSSISWKPTQERLYTICVRVEEVVDGESDVDNNAACKTLLVGPRPDLAVFASNITWTPIEPHEGDVVTVKANVSNLALVAGKADVSLWLGDPDTDGELLGTAENVALEVGEYAMVNWTTWQPTQAGTYNLTVVIHNVEHGDANLTNNRANFTIEVLPHVLLPDLYVKAILLSDGNISQNERLEVTLRIGNNGSVAAGSFIVKFYIDGFMAHSHTVGTGVAPFGFADVIVEWPVDNASGAYEITVKLDAMGQVEEWDELNNEVTLDLRVKEGEGDQGWFADFSVPGWGRSVAVAVAVAGVMALAAAGMASYTSENRRWLLYMALLLPLLTKVRKEELEKPDKFKAGRLYQTIMLNPGINLAALRDVTGMANGTLIYHLDRLERGGEVRSHKQGQLRLFYPTEESVQQERDGGLRYMHRTQKRVLQLLMEVKEANQRIIATSLEMKQQLVSYHLRELMLAGHIKRRGFRGFYSYQIVGDIDPKLLDTR